MERPDLSRLRERLLRAARRLQDRAPRIWVDGRARPEDRAAVDELVRAGHRELVRKR